MWMQSLDDFIKQSLDKREITRAMAVKMLLCGYKHTALPAAMRYILKTESFASRGAGRKNCIA